MSSKALGVVAAAATAIMNRAQAEEYIPTKKPKPQLAPLPEILHAGQHQLPPAHQGHLQAALTKAAQAHGFGARRFDWAWDKPNDAGIGGLHITRKGGDETVAYYWLNTLPSPKRQPPRRRAQATTIRVAPRRPEASIKDNSPIPTVGPNQIQLITAGIGSVVLRPSDHNVVIDHTKQYQEASRIRQAMSRTTYLVRRLQAGKQPKGAQDQVATGIARFFRGIAGVYDKPEPQPRIVRKPRAPRLSRKQRKSIAYSLACFFHDGMRLAHKIAADEHWAAKRAARLTSLRQQKLRSELAYHPEWAEHRSRIANKQGCSDAEYNVEDRNRPTVAYYGFGERWSDWDDEGDIDGPNDITARLGDLDPEDYLAAIDEHKDTDQREAASYAGGQRAELAVLADAAGLLHAGYEVPSDPDWGCSNKYGPQPHMPLSTAAGYICHYPEALEPQGGCRREEDTECRPSEPINLGGIEARPPATKTVNGVELPTSGSTLLL